MTPLPTFLIFSFSLESLYPVPIPSKEEPAKSPPLRFWASFLFRTSFWLGLCKSKFKIHVWVICMDRSTKGYVFKGKIESTASWTIWTFYPVELKLVSSRENVLTSDSFLEVFENSPKRQSVNGFSFNLKLNWGMVLVQWHKILSHNLEVRGLILVVGIICHFYFSLTSMIVLDLQVSLITKK